MQDAVRQGIATRLKESRLGASLSQTHVAKELGVSRQAVASWEAAKTMPGTREWYYLAQLYGTSLDYLVYGVRTIPVSKYQVVAEVFKPPADKVK